MGTGFTPAAIKLEAENPCYICIIGGPGSGKTTQSRFMNYLILFIYLLDKF